VQGSKPVDGGNLLLDAAERAELLSAAPSTAPLLRRFLGGDELINGSERWCLWLKDATPEALRKLPAIRSRLERVRDSRLASRTKAFRDAASTPALFAQDRQPVQPYLAIPEVSSEARRFVPMAFLEADVIASNKLLTLSGAGNFHLGVLSSTMHMAWVRAVAGRLESRYSYAPSVYNTFPWPDPTPAQKQKIEATAQGILDARAAHPGATLADLYDPLAMPADLLRAHQANDRAVDAAYGVRGFATEAARLAFLFERYQALAAPLDAAPAPKRRRRAAGDRAGG
jgi:hypothetical protein